MKLANSPTVRSPLRTRNAPPIIKQILVKLGTKSRAASNNERNLIAYKRKYEEYAANVGMIRKVYKDLSIVNFDTLNVKFGKEIFMDVIDYGN